MIKAVIFDLDNTLLDFISVKKKAVDAAILAMVEAGLNVDADLARKNIFDIYIEHEIKKKNSKLQLRAMPFYFFLFKRIDVTE